MPGDDAIMTMAAFSSGLWQKVSDSPGSQTAAWGNLARQDTVARDFGDTFVWREGGRVITIEAFRAPTAQTRQTLNRTRLSWTAISA